MVRSLAVVLLLVPTLLFAEDKKEPTFTVHTGHFEQNTSGLKDEPSLLLLADDDAFGKVFGTVPPAGLGGGVRKPNPVTKDVFEKNVVAAVIKRGKAITTYVEVGTWIDGETLTVTFKSEEGKPGTATFASPLIVAVPKGKFTKVVFVGNGMEIGSPCFPLPQQQRGDRLGVLDLAGHTHANRLREVHDHRLQLLVGLPPHRPRRQPLGHEQVQFLVQHPRRGVQVAETGPPLRRIPGLFGQLASRTLLQRLARLHRPGRQFPQRLADHEPVVPQQHHPPVAEQWQNHHRTGVDDYVSADDGAVRCGGGVHGHPNLAADVNGLAGHHFLRANPARQGRGCVGFGGWHPRPWRAGFA
jgi:hypothetical protein